MNQHIQRPLTVIVLAGGLGKRMQSDLPKVLHPIHGEPMIVRILKEVHQLRPQRTLVVVNPLTHDQIKTTVQEHLHQDDTNNANNANNIEYIVQNEPRGTGHAILSCIPSINTLTDNVSKHTVLILSGDVPLLRAETMHQIADQVDLVKIATTVLDNPQGYGRILTTNINATEQFCRIVEERDCTEEEKCIHKVNCGVYAFDSTTLCQYIVQVQPNNAQQEYYLTDVVHLISQGEQTVVDMVDIPVHQQYQLLGVNTPEQLAQVEALAIVDPIPVPVPDPDPL